MDSRRDKEKRNASGLVAMRRVTLLLDGLSRSAILSFGPRLLHRILFEEDDELEMRWSQVAFPFAVTLVMYCLGRGVGSAIAERVHLDPARQIHTTARFGGATLSLQLFSFGAGVNTILWLSIIRFVSGMLAGFLCRATNVNDRYHDKTNAAEYDEELGPTLKVQTRTGSSLAEFTSGAAVMYTMGFTLSLLFGGLFYEGASKNKQFHELTGAEPFLLTPMFFVLCSVIGEACLRVLLWWFSEHVPPSTEYTTTTPILLSNEDAAVFPREAVIDPLSFVSPTAETITEGEFFDPLSQSRHRFSTPNRSRKFSMDGSVRSRASSGTTGRGRANSATSLNSAEFFDCESFGDIEGVSAVGDEEMLIDDSGHGIEWGNHSSTDISTYEDNKTVYVGGFPAFVPIGECEEEVPDNFIRCWGEKRAKKMWIEMQEWRREKNIWRIHTGPHKLFPRVKESIFQSLHGHSKAGFPILYEKPGKMKLKKLFQSGVTIDEMLYHYFFMMEFISNVICTKEEVMQRRGCERHRSSNWNFLVVMDFEGISMSMVSKDVISYMSKCGDVNARYYPLTTGRVFLINAPFWLSGVWGSMKSMIPDSVEFEICSKRESLNKLLQYIDEDQIPKEYGGSSPYATDQHPYELEMRHMVKKYQNAEKFDANPLRDPNAGNRTYSFSYSDQQWMPENGTYHDDVSQTLNSGSWKPEISASPIKSTVQSLRRRAGSSDILRSEPTKLAVTFEKDFKSGTAGSSGSSGGILALTSFIYFVWFAIQGALQCLLPLYILTPPILGGLGYSSSRGGFSLFCASVLFQFLMRTKFAGFVSQVPRKAPMRGLRTGIGLEIATLILLPVLHNSVVSVARVESVVNIVSTIVFVAAIALAAVTGMNSISILHKIACENFALCQNQTNFMVGIYGADRLYADCQSGKLAFLLSAVAEMLGIIAVAPLYSWSTFRERPTPLDAGCSFFAAAFALFVLYVLSFSLQLNVVGKFRDPSANSGDNRRSRTCAFVGDMCSVPISDFRMILEEANVGRA